MAHWRNLFENKYVGAWTFEKGPAVVTIEKVQIEDVIGEAGRKDRLPVLYFTGAKLPMVCGAANCKNMEAVTKKTDPQEWVGAVIELYATTCKLKGETRPCVRIRAAKKELK